MENEVLCIEDYMMYEGNKGFTKGQIYKYSHVDHTDIYYFNSNICLGDSFCHELTKPAFKRYFIDPESCQLIQDKDLQIEI